MANIKRLSKTSNIILLAVMLCCIGGCFSLMSLDAKKSQELDDEIKGLPCLELEDDINRALAEPELHMYLFVNYKFPRLEYIADPGNNFPEKKYIYLEYTESKWHDRVVKKGKVKKKARWSVEAYKKLYANLFLTKHVALEGFTDAHVEGCDQDTVNRDSYKYEYKYISTSDPCTFVAAIGQGSAKLGYNGNSVLVKGNIDTLVSASSKNASHAVLGCFLVFSVIGIAIYVIRDIAKH